MNRALGKLENRLFAYTQMRGQPTVRTGELVQQLGFTGDQEREVFRRLARAQLIARVRPGLYLVPPRLPPGGTWSPGETLALNTLMADRDGRYQICGPNAFSRYDFDAQIPTRVYAYNNRISGERSIGSVRFTLIKVADGRLGDTEEVEVDDAQVAVFSSRARSLLDAVYDWSRFNTLPSGYEWIKTELAAGRVTPEELVETTVRYADIGTTRRIGVLLDRAGVDPRRLRRLENRLSPSKSLIAWIPTQPKRGSSDRRWGVVVNGDI